MVTLSEISCHSEYVCVCVSLYFPTQICSLMRGGIAERGGVRVGHRIIEINSQSVVATAHEKIVQALSNSVGEVRTSPPTHTVHTHVLHTQYQHWIQRWNYK